MVISPYNSVCYAVEVDASQQQSDGFTYFLCMFVFSCAFLQKIKQKQTNQQMYLSCRRCPEGSWAIIETLVNEAFTLSNSHPPPT